MVRGVRLGRLRAAWGPYFFWDPYAFVGKRGRGAVSYKEDMQQDSAPAVRTIEPTASAREAAARMAEHHVGFLVVVEDGRTAGVLTDRDLALGVLARGRHPLRCQVAELMTHPAVTLPEGASAALASRTMRERGIRKLPIVDESGRPVAVITADDLVLSAGARLHSLARAVQHELRNEAHPEALAPVLGRE